MQVLGQNQVSGGVSVLYLLAAKLFQRERNDMSIYPCTCCKRNTVLCNLLSTVTPNDRPKSVRNHCVIEVFGGVFVLSHCFLDFSEGAGAFVIGLSKICSFFSY